MHFSSITIGVTTLFILSRLAAASSDHVDVDVAAPLPNPGQLKPAYELFAPHHHRKGGENGFASHYHRHRLTDDHYPHPFKGNRLTGAAQEQEVPAKLRQRQLIPPTTERAVNNMLMGTLFRRAPTKSHSASGNTAQLAKQSISISNKVSSAANEYQAVQKALAGIPGAARNSLVQTSVKIQREFSQLQGLYRQQTMAIQAADSSYRRAETNGKKLWGRSPIGLQALPRNTLSRRAPTNSLAQLEKQTAAISAKVDEAWREQQTLRKALAGAGWQGSARTAMDRLGNQIDDTFHQLRNLLHQSLAIAR